MKIIDNSLEDIKGAGLGCLAGAWLVFLDLGSKTFCDNSANTTQSIYVFYRIRMSEKYVYLLFVIV